MNRRVRIHRLSPSAELPRYATTGAAGFDLAACADVVIDPGRTALIPTGLIIEVPAGMFLAIFARSSTPLKRGLMVANGVGIVDSDYCGATDEVKVPVLNITASAVTVKAGERIAQGILLPVAQVEWEEVGVMQKDTRGGFGSTGG